MANSTTRRIESILEQAILEYKQGNWNKSIELCNSCLGLDPLNLEAIHQSSNIMSISQLWESWKNRVLEAINIHDNHILWNDVILSANYYDDQEFLSILLNKYRNYLNDIYSQYSTEIVRKPKINIGYISSDFREHAVSYFFSDLISNHNRDKFNVYFYSNTPYYDHITSKLYEGSIARGISKLSDKEVKDLIVSDSIDILIDLNGHTFGNRLGVLALRSAPIQISFLGFLSTTNVINIDYKLVYGNIKDKSLYTEKILTLNNGPLYSPILSPTILEQPFDKNGYVTFGSFNATKKISKEVLSVWDIILQSNESSKIIIASSGSKEHDQWIRSFLNIHESRIQFIDDLPMIDYLQKLSSVDICLDPFPHAGGATTAHAAWMGTPTISLDLQQERSNLSIEILKVFNLHDFIASDIEKYIELSNSIDINRLRQFRTVCRNYQQNTQAIKELELLYEQLYNSVI